MHEWGLWSQVFVCLLRDRRKVVKTMPKVQCSLPGKVVALGSSRNAQAGEHGGLPPPYTEIFLGHTVCCMADAAFFSDKKGLYAAQCYPDLRQRG